MRQVFLHAELGSTEILLLLGDRIGYGSHLLYEVGIDVVQVHSVAYTWVFLESLLVEVELGALLHQE